MAEIELSPRSEHLWKEAMVMAGAIADMSPDGVRNALAHLSRVEDLSKEESLSFAGQVQRWLRADGGSFPDRARQLLKKERSD
jgi:hypothetical protein